MSGIEGKESASLPRLLQPHAAILPGCVQPIFVRAYDSR
jgi:hypothetical protein